MAARRPATSAKKTAVASLLAAAILAFSPAEAGAIAGKHGDVWQGASQSWGLGLVLPNGSELANGAQLSWAEARNITVLARLPNITDPEGVTYVVLSAEGDDGAVFQVAAGVWPGCDSWSVYSWYVTGMGSSSLSYRWVANNSAPSMAPRDQVTMSITLEKGAWHTSVRDATTAHGFSGSVSSPKLSRFAAGDQEVFALESYTGGVSTFREMGNMSLLGLWVDGGRVASGWYAHGGWDPGHSPLFEVGSSAPPTFVTLSMSGDGNAVWSYDVQWTGAVWTTVFQPMVLAYAALALLVPLAFMLGRRVGHKRQEAGR